MSGSHAGRRAPRAGTPKALTIDGASYTLDNNGKTTSQTVSSATTNYSWDYENRLTSVTLPGSGGTVSFKYDPFGHRIYKSSSSNTSVFAYDGDSVTEILSSSGASVARYVQGQDRDEPLAVLVLPRGAATSYYEADGLGSVTSLTNSSGSIAQAYTFGLCTRIRGDRHFRLLSEKR
jgi:YD repeat-containing protein